jgi:hypothetical protein
MLDLKSVFEDRKRNINVFTCFSDTRPNIPEFQQIPDQIKQALDEVYYSNIPSMPALNDVAPKSVDGLGCKVGATQYSTRSRKI